MDRPERPHDAAPLELAAGWIALCATCGWVGETYGTESKAAAESARHIAETPGGTETALAFLGDSKRVPR